LKKDESFLKKMLFRAESLDSYKDKSYYLLVETNVDNNIQKIKNLYEGFKKLTDADDTVKKQYVNDNYIFDVIDPDNENKVKPIHGIIDNTKGIIKKMEVDDIVSYLTKKQDSELKREQEQKQNSQTTYTPKTQSSYTPPKISQPPQTSYTPQQTSYTPPPPPPPQRIDVLTGKTYTPSLDWEMKQMNRMMRRMS